MDLKETSAVSPVLEKEVKSSNISLETYARENGIEIQPIQFYCLPCRHEGAASAEAVINNLSEVSPDLVLFEDTHGHKGTNFQEQLKVIEHSGQTGDGVPIDSFNWKVLRYLINSGIEVKPLNGKFDTEKQAVDFAKKMADTFEFGSTIMKTAEIKDDEDAWKFIEAQWDLHIMNIIKLQNRREEDTLSNIAPTILSSSNIKQIRKVAVIFGSDHAKSFFETIRDRGEKVTLVQDDFTKYAKTGDFSSLREPSFFLWSLLAPFGGEIALRGKDLYEFEKALGQKVVSIEKVKEIFMKLRHNNLRLEDIKI